MRRFAVCFSSLGIFAAAIVSGCSSDNTTPDAGTDANTTTMDSSTVDAPAESSVVDTGKEAAACVPVDASVETIAAGSQWGCYQSACSTQLTACAADCICNGTILASLGCAAAGGDSVTCFTNAIISSRSESQVVLTLGCLQMKMGMCSGTTEGGTEAGTEGGAEGGPAEGGADTGVDGGTEGGVDGGVDGAVTDAPAAG
jgi:hypothetical protein